MKSGNLRRNVVEELEVGLRSKLASLWASFMFLYIYIDYFHLYMPRSLTDIMAGMVFQFYISQIFLLAAMASVVIPALMIFLSVALPARVCRWTNIITATVYIPYTLFNLVGEAWMHMVLGAVAEIAVLSIVIRYSWKWPRSHL